MLQIHRIVNTPVPSNCFVLFDNEKGNDCIIVDPGSKSEAYLIEFIDREGLHPLYIILTHEHFDHCWGVNELVKQYHIPIICSQLCAEAIKHEKRNCSVFYDNKEVSASSPERSVLDTTGPYMTTRVYANSKYRKRVSLIPAELVAPLTRNEVLRMIDGKLSESLENKIDNSFAIHYFLCSWYEQTRKSGCSNS